MLIDFNSCRVCNNNNHGSSSVVCSKIACIELPTSLSKKGMTLSSSFTTSVFLSTKVRAVIRCYRCSSTVLYGC